jgi:hypothetical protein
MKMRIGSWRDGLFLPTRQCLIGYIGGLGIGTVFGSFLSLGWHPAVVIPGFALAAVASYFAQAEYLAKSKR